MASGYNKINPGGGVVGMPAPVTAGEFLKQQDLEVLKDNPISAVKDPGFKSFMCCTATTITVTSCGFGYLAAPAMCCINQIYDNAYLSINDEQVEFSQPTPSCCVLAKTQRTVRYENITDTTIEDDCCLQLFGLKKLIVQTAGTGGVGDANLNGIQAMFLQDPDVWKAAINHAVKLSRGMAAPGAQGMTRSAVPQVAKRQKGQLDNIAELARLRVITEAQANDMRTGALLKQEDYTVQLLAMNELVQQGHLTRQHFDAAVQLVLQKIHS